MTIKRMKGFRTSFKKTGEDQKWYFLKVNYDKNYMGQIMIKDIENDVPKIIKILQKGLKEFKIVKKLNKKKKEK